jgi:hypothetical protein
MGPMPPTCSLLLHMNHILSSDIEPSDAAVLPLLKAPIQRSCPHRVAPCCDDWVLKALSKGCSP